MDTEIELESAYNEFAATVYELFLRDIIGPYLTIKGESHILIPFLTRYVCVLLTTSKSIACDATSARRNATSVIGTHIVFVVGHIRSRPCKKVFFSSIVRCTLPRLTQSVLPISIAWPKPLSWSSGFYTLQTTTSNCLNTKKHIRVSLHLGNSKGRIGNIRVMNDTPTSLYLGSVC